ncbi:MAG: Dual specificity protein phosphatase [Solirubrobacterales bacterium]|nr:Dual specificity protein phosphatase [Solirubrobacterales bacterium]
MSHWFETYGFRPVSHGLVTGAYPLDAGDVERLAAEAGVTCVLNLCHDEEYGDGERMEVEAAYAEHGVHEHRLQVADYSEVMPGLLEQGASIAVPWLQSGETVYIHCRAGWQRSATVAAGVLALHVGVEPDEALGRIQRRKPSAQPLHHQLEGLRRWWRGRQAGAAGRRP